MQESGALRGFGNRGLRGPNTIQSRSVSIPFEVRAVKTGINREHKPWLTRLRRLFRFDLACVHENPIHHYVICLTRRASGLIRPPVSTKKGARERRPLSRFESVT